MLRRSRQLSYYQPMHRRHHHPLPYHCRRLSQLRNAMRCKLWTNQRPKRLRSAPQMFQKNKNHSFNRTPIKVFRFRVIRKHQLSLSTLLNLRKYSRSLFHVTRHLVPMFNSFKSRSTQRMAIRSTRHLFHQVQLRETTKQNQLVSNHHRFHLTPQYLALKLSFSVQPMINRRRASCWISKHARNPPLVSTVMISLQYIIIPNPIIGTTTVTPTSVSASVSIQTTSAGATPVSTGFTTVSSPSTLTTGVNTGTTTKRCDESTSKKITVSPADVPESQKPQFQPNSKQGVWFPSDEKTPTITVNFGTPAQVQSITLPRDKTSGANVQQFEVNLYSTNGNKINPTPIPSSSSPKDDKTKPARLDSSQIPSDTPVSRVEIKLLSTTDDQAPKAVILDIKACTEPTTGEYYPHLLTYHLSHSRCYNWHDRLHKWFKWKYIYYQCSNKHNHEEM